MITPIGTNIVEWMKRYQIDESPIQCSKCEKLLEFKIPVAFGDYRGAKCDEADHECGKNFTPIRLVSIAEEKKPWQYLREMFDEPS